MRSLILAALLALTPLALTQSATITPAAATDAAWLTVANESDYIQIPAGTTVRYGAYPSGCFPGGWSTPPTYTGQAMFAVSNGNFGADPAPGQVKVLQVQEQPAAFSVMFDPYTELNKVIAIPAQADGNATSAPDPGKCTVTEAPPTNGGGNGSPAVLAIGPLALNYSLGQSFAALLPITGGTGPIVLCSADANMPSWLQVENVNGQCYLSGTPNLAGNYTFGVSIEDSSTPTIQKASGTVTATITQAAAAPSPAGPFTIALPANAITLQSCYQWSDTVSGLYGFACQMPAAMPTNPPQ